MNLPAFIELGQSQSDSESQSQTAVVFLHGIGGGKSIWGEDGSGAVRALAAGGYRAVAMDFPGYGESLDLGPPSMASMVQAVLSLIAHLQAKRCVLVGHSMGGMVAQELVAQRPVAVQGLVLACTSPAFGKSDGAWQARFVAERLKPLDDGLGMAGMADTLVPGLVSPHAPASALSSAHAVMSRVPEATYRAALQTIASFDQRQALASFALPTLCLAAEHDRTASPEVMRRMAQHIHGAEFECLANAGHIANVEQPAAFNAAVLGFMQRHFPPG